MNTRIQAGYLELGNNMIATPIGTAAAAVCNKSVDLLWQVQPSPCFAAQLPDASLQPGGSKSPPFSSKVVYLAARWHAKVHHNTAAAEWTMPTNSNFLADAIAEALGSRNTRGMCNASIHLPRVCSSRSMSEMLSAAGSHNGICATDITSSRTIPIASTYISAFSSDSTDIGCSLSSSSMTCSRSSSLTNE